MLEDTSIPLKKDTRDRLKTFGVKGESWNVVLNKVMNELHVCRKENDAMQELRDIIFGPIKHHMMNSTPEEIDSLDLSGMMPELEKRLKTFWKRFALLEENNDDSLVGKGLVKVTIEKDGEERYSITDEGRKILKGM